MSLAALAVEYGHAEPIEIHFDELDAMGLVHNARYAVLLERALAGYWARYGHSYRGGRPTSPDAFTAVREFTIAYQVPIRGTGEVLVHFWLEHLGGSSAVYGFRFVSPDGSTTYAEGRRVNVRLDPATLRPAPWTDAARSVAVTLLKP
ncbi:acyl-CoA thioesterase [Rhizomonospora bruguierae]|uniref:acyl-CoA thioesterase n=1 Tax=Rhizomonospora bruguierae TaxID=1581705 RepID=UPI001BCC6FDB|nr:hotdog domain-containing protein [Micromonospora sp. NBRC 107566]